MSEKPNGSAWTIREQIIRDEASGLTLQFELRPDGTPCLRIWGEALPFGNRQIGFDLKGNETDAGTATAGCPATSWIRRA